MGRESTQLAPTRSELINMGLLYTPAHGYAGFTVPYFDRFMLRAVPHLDVPQRKQGARNQRNKLPVIARSNTGASCVAAVGRKETGPGPLRCVRTLTAHRLFAWRYD